MNQEKDMVIETVLEYLKQKHDLTDLEKDILSTRCKHNEQPFDRKSAEEKVVENNSKYPDIFISISSMPGINVIPFNKISDMDVKDSLKLQIEALCFKEYAAMKDRRNIM